MAEFIGMKRSRIGDSDEFDSPEVKRLREDLLENFEDGEFDAASLELDSFMKSFEDEIVFGPSAPAPAVVDLTSDSGESQPDLGYLLGASDDELGLPPSGGEGCRSIGEETPELTRVESSSSGISSEFWEFCGTDLPNYDSFDAGLGEFGDYVSTGDGGGEYVALDDLFDYSDLGFGSNELVWRPETLPVHRTVS